MQYAENVKHTSKTFHTNNVLVASKELVGMLKKVNQSNIDCSQHLQISGD
jgi:hypothetical protein